MTVLFYIIFSGAVHRMTKTISSYVESYEYVEDCDGPEVDLCVDALIGTVFFHKVFSVAYEMLGQKWLCLLDRMSMDDSGPA